MMDLAEMTQTPFWRVSESMQDTLVSLNFFVETTECHLYISLVEYLFVFYDPW